jgi:ABC-type transport system involved in cytochrome c biogenesis permease subunit
MLHRLPLVVALLALLFVASTFVVKKPQSPYDIDGFGHLPTLVNGRIKPLDTVARTSLLYLQHRQTFRHEGRKLHPTEWLMYVAFRPEVADHFEHFLIHHDDVRAVFGLSGSNQKRFSFEQLRAGIPELERQAQLAEPIEPQLRTPFQREILSTRNRMMLYHRLKHSLQMPDSPDFLRELTQFQDTLPEGLAALRARQAGEPFDERAFQRLAASADRYDFMAQMGYILPIPPPAHSTDPDNWTTVGRAILRTFETRAIDANVMAYAAIGHGFREDQPEVFNEVVRLYRAQMEKRFGDRLHKSLVEFVFNHAAPFYRATELYVIAFLLGVCSWLRWPTALGRAAFYVGSIAWILTTAGIATRMWLEGRPPVTNLYSSALFVGWGAVALGLVLERIYRNAVGSVVSGLIGFATLVIAHHLSFTGDTLEMMRAVLDSNFWLATHVVVITIGYSAVFLAGTLAIVYIVRGVFTTSLDKTTADALTRMVYGITCFATLFSLVGTILGGIWADQSWGRFWGWDPKENGALMIVLWCAVILHARWGGLVKQRGLMNLAIVGNIITAWSWFGTNMLGVGLHSYGFMEKGFVWLVAFVASQIGLIAMGCLPLTQWKSFAPRASGAQVTRTPPTDPEPARAG